MAHTDAHGAHGAHGTHGAHGAKINHETTDIPLGGTTRAALITLGIIGAAIALMYGMWGLLISYAQRDDPGRPPMAAEDFGQRIPPTPRLQTMPQTDLVSYRAEQASRLASYGWVDQASGAVHIPIEVAIGLVAERAAEFADPSASAAAPEAAPAGDTPAATEPNPTTPAIPGAAKPGQGTGPGH
jgi:hypothetical protein